MPKKIHTFEDLEFMPQMPYSLKPPAAKFIAKLNFLNGLSIKVIDTIAINGKQLPYGVCVYVGNTFINSASYSTTDKNDINETIKMCYEYEKNKQNIHLKK